MWRVGGRRAAWRSITAVLAALVLAAAAAHVAGARQPVRGDAAGAVSGRFDYYLLTLSWSPTYCLIHPNQTKCDVRGYGFVLHGLWPQYLGGGWPERCPSERELTPAAVHFARGIYPAAELVTHEWRRHGVCSGLDALAYFEAADRARTAIHIPPWLDAPARPQQATVATLITALRAVNPALPADGVAIACTRGELAEVRICLGRDFAPTSCGRGVRTHCPTGALDVPAAR